MADGFLGRWSRRKQDAREGKPLAQEAAAPPTMPAPAPVPAAAAPVPPAQATPPQQEGGVVPAAEAPPPPTLADAQALTPDSDFKPFVARAVPPEVRNLAMKKLFADPHFNVMDGLDIYVGDYTQPDPLPAGMLRKLASAHALGLFDHEKPAHAAAPPEDGAQAAAIAPAHAQPREDAGAAEAPDVAQSGVCTAVPSAAPSEPAPAATPAVAAAPASHPEHDHDASLRLQPDHAPQREGAGRGTA